MFIRQPFSPYCLTILQQFPYSRHSSYMELCELVSAFKPKDVFPCTTDPLSWDENTSIRTLFGHLCSGDQFSHDTHMREIITNDEELLRSRKRARYEVDSPLQSSHQSDSFMESGPRACNSFSSEPEPEAGPGPGPGQDQNPSTKPDIMTSRLPSSSSTTTRGILLPSFMESIPEHPPHTDPNEPLSIPNLTPETERVKRNEIRHAWRYLKSNLPHGIANLGPLPSSWPPEEEDALDDSHSKDKNDNDNENENENENAAVNMNMDGAVASPPQTASCSPSPSPSPPSHNPNTQAENNNHPNDNDHDDDDTIQPESQETNPLSIPDSAFASSFSSFSSSQGQGQEQDHPHPHPHTHPLALSSGPTSAPPSTTAAISQKNRKAAYLAARADDFEKWSLVSLVSAGNNHTEEEVEL